MGTFKEWHVKLAQFGKTKAHIIRIVAARKFEEGWEVHMKY
jgi:hypothetical protein